MKSLTFSCQTIIYHIPSQFSITVIMLNIQVLRKSSLHQDKSAYTYSIVPFECLQNDTHTFYSLSSVSSLGLIIRKGCRKFFPVNSVLMPCLGDIGFFQSRILRYLIFFSVKFSGAIISLLLIKNNKVTSTTSEKEKDYFFFIYLPINFIKVSEFRPSENNSS